MASQVALLVKNPPANMGDMRCRFHPWIRKIPGGEHGNPFQFSGLENPMNRGARQAIVHGVEKESDMT